MGQQPSKSEDDNFVIFTNDPIDVFEFDSAQSQLVSYGIDHQTNPEYSHKALGPLAAKDAEQVRDSLVDIGAFQSQNTAVYVGSKQVEDCTFAGIKRTFQECAAKVGPNGLLIFHFSGHGIEMGTDEWGLAPVDYDRSRSTCLTASVLVSWMNETQCKAKHILFTLDCCYAGGIGEKLTKSVKIQTDANIYVMSACTGSENSISLESLNNSVFVYFLYDTISKCQFQAGLLPITEIFSRCQACCQSLSSLLVLYQPDGDELLTTLKMKPQIGFRTLEAKSQELLGEGEDQVDAEIGRFDYAVSLYDRKQSISQLSEKTFAYLETAANMNGGPLLKLQREGVLTQSVLNAALCSMMYSVASTELVNNSSVVANPNHSIMAFINCVAAIDKIHSGVEFDEHVFKESLSYYREVLMKNEVNISSLDSLFQRLAKDVEGTDSGPVDSTDFPDSAYVSSNSHRWTPL